MKTTYIKLKFLFLIIFFSVGTLIAQPPNIPYAPNGNNPPTPDEDISSPNATEPPYIYSCPSGPCGGGGGGGGGPLPTCIFNDINRTGNDLVFWKPDPINSPSYEISVKAITWDSDCPAFTLVIADESYDYSTIIDPFIAQLHGNNYGTVKDPDIIISISDATPNELTVIIVYELHMPNRQFIAYEQWHYDLTTQTLSLYTPTAPNIISNIGGSNPNIDINHGGMENDMVIVFKDNGRIFSYIKDVHNAIPLNLNIADMFSINCISPGGRTPDVSISDDSPYPSVVSYIYEDQQDLYLVQELASNLYISGGMTCANAIQLAFNYVNPRISSPASQEIVHQFEFAATAVDDDYEDISVFHNYNGSINHFSNFNDVLLQQCQNSNFMPSITFTGHKSPDMHSVAVAWTYDDACTFNQNGSKEVYSANLNLISGTRTPVSPYIMGVNKFDIGDQFASSVAGERIEIRADGREVGDVFYAVASQNGMNKIIHKVSITDDQPYLRKKFNTSEIETALDNVHIYPNPSNGFINFDLSSLEQDEKINVTVYSVQGKEILSISSTASYLKTMDLSKIESGIYFIEIETSRHTYQQKLLLKK